MPIDKKPCINNPKYQYSGKEESPLGLGYAPDGELSSLYMKGRDTRTWMRSMKNGVPVWVRVPDDVANLGKDAPVIAEPPAAPVKAPKSDAKEDEDNQTQPKKLDFDAVEEEPVAPKKKVVKKKAVAKVAEEPKVDDPKADEPEAPKKKAAAKKAPAKKKAEAEAPEKPKRPLSNYQKYMGWRMNQLKESQPGNKGNFTQAAAEWKAMSDTEKVAIMEQVNA